MAHRPGYGNTRARSSGDAVHVIVMLIMIIMKVSMVITLVIMIVLLMIQNNNDTYD